MAFEGTVHVASITFGSHLLRHMFEDKGPDCREVRGIAFTREPLFSEDVVGDFQDLVRQQCLLVTLSNCLRGS